MAREKLYIMDINILNATFTFKIKADDEYEAKLKMQEELLKNIMIDKIQTTPIQKEETGFLSNMKVKLKEMLVL